MAAPHIRQLKDTRLKDSDWIKKSFMMSNININGDLEYFRQFTTASGKFTNTTLGGNFPINNIPQYTRYADIRVGGIRPESVLDDDLTYSAGMGRYYSESIDDNSELIHFQFGTPDFKGMITFFTGFYDAAAGQLANKGRVNWATTAIYYAGKTLGLIATVRFAPLLMLGYMGNYFLNRATSKYYTLKPSMEPYWNRVNFIANSMAANMNLIPRVLDLESIPKELQAGLESLEEDSAEMALNAHRLAPNIFRKGGGVDVYQISNKTQRMANLRYDELLARDLAGSSASKRELRDEWIRFYNETMPTLVDDGGEGINQALARYHQSVLGDNSEEQVNASRQAVLAQQALNGDSDQNDLDQIDVDALQGGVSSAAKQANEDQAASDGWLRPVWRAISEGNYQEAYQLVFSDSEFGRSLEANGQNGNQWATFKVDWSGEVSETMSNSVGESGIASTLNSTSSSIRNINFSTSNGETGFGLVDEAFKAVKAFGAGVLDGIQLSGLVALAGNAFVDIPKVWEDSSISLPSMNYTMKLRAPYGHPLSRFMNIHVPLAMILAGVLPISTGKQSYTQPYICQMFNRGKAFSRLAMITDVSITRGTGNMGFNSDNEMLGADVTITVTDLSSIMHAPIDDHLFNPVRGIFDDDNIFNDYMATLSNVSLDDQIYRFRKLSIALAKKKFFISNYTSPGFLANQISGTAPFRLLSGLAPVSFKSQL